MAGRPSSEKSLPFEWGSFCENPVENFAEMGWPEELAQTLQSARFAHEPEVYVAVAAGARQYRRQPPEVELAPVEDWLTRSYSYTFSHMEAC